MSAAELPINRPADLVPLPDEPAPTHPVLRNTLFLTVSQAIGVPLSVLTNIVTARYLGAAAFGYMYVGATFNSLGFLAVDWGQTGALPGLIATDHPRANRYLGTNLIWQLAAASVIYFVLLGLCFLMGYGREVRIVMSLYFIGYTLSGLSNACQAVMIGFERADVPAYRQVIEQLAVVFIVVPILMLGGDVYITLVGHATATLIVLAYVWRSLPSANVVRLSVDRDTLKILLRKGTPFVVLSVAMVLQPTIDAGFLSKMAPADVVGWYSAARRLIGFLIFPASALVGALYPTLSRLHQSDSNEFAKTAAGALRWTSVLVMPIALGCAFYPDLAIALYSRQAFGPAADDLRLLSIFLFLLYFTMPIGICILASGRQKIWAVVQSLCIAVSLIVDPIAVPWFQQRMGNGGLGLCLAAIISEIIVLCCGVWLVPRGILGRRFVRSLGPVAIAGIAMAAVSYALQSVNGFIAAPIAVVAYFACLWMTGGVDQSFVIAMRGIAERKLSRLRQRA